MKSENFIMRIIARFLYLAILLHLSPVAAQLIPASDRVNWPGAGLWTDPPSCADTVFQVNLMSGANWDEKFANARAQAKSYINSNPTHWAIIYFPSGTYTLTTEVNIDQSYRNIVFQGAGSNETTLKFDMGGTNQNCFHIFGSDPETNKRNLATDLNKGSTTIQCTQSIGYTTPCWIRLSEEDHPYHDSWAAKYVGQITRLENTNGVIGTLKDAASKQYTVARNTKIWPITPVMNIGIENLKIWRMDDGYTTDGSGRNINFQVAVNCWVKGVRFEQTTRHHVFIEKCSHIYISGCYFHDARHFCDNEPGGYAYGVALSKSNTNCLIENNVFHKLRHAMVAQAGSNCNVFAFNYSYEQKWQKDLWGCIWIPGDWESGVHGPGGDISIHGNYPYANLFEHNYCERIVADGSHGENWKWNAIVRNRLTNDHDSDQALIKLKKCPYTSVIGNILAPNIASIVEYAYCDMYRDIFGILGSVGWSHNYFLLGYGDEEDATLSDVSYFYSSRPEFLPGNYTWPTIGPKVSSGSGSLSQTIPAKARFSQDIKTYIDQPTPRILTYSGTLPYDQTWSGTHTLTGNITVPQGVTLTIAPGSYIRTNSQIIVQGALVAEGTEANPITFNSISGGWIGLWFENSSDDLNCILEYCDIKNASYGVYTDNAAPTIKNCTIRYNLYGIYENAPASQTIENNEICYNTYEGVLIMSPSSSMIIDNNDFHNYGRNLFLYDCDYATSVLDNKIHDSGYNSEGIYMWASSPILLNNFIYDNGGHGINCIYDSDPEFWYDYYTGNNVVAYNNFQGVKIDNSSVPILGGLNEDDEPASNSFYDNGNYDVYSEQSSTIDATYNYWKYATPDVYGNVNTAYALSSDPNPDPHNLSKSMAEITGVNNLDTTIDSVNAKARALFDKGLDFELKKQYSAAIGLYKNVISTYPDAFEASLAIVHINKCYNKLQNINEGRDYIRQIANSHQNKLGYKARELNAKWLQKAKKFDEALTEYNQIINNMPNSLMVKNALLNKWLIYFNIKKNKQTARSIMTDFENSFPDDEWTLFMKVALGDITPDNAPELPNRKKPFNKETLGEEQITVKQFALYRNYPNPFNPDTRIKYDIPEADHVTLQIFDIQGREVARLVNSQKNAGRHVAIWNSKDKYGSQAASGVYFYRIRYRDYVVTRKMVLAR